MYVHKLIPSSGDYYEILKYIISRVNESYFTITKESRTYIVSDEGINGLEPSHSMYIVNTSGHALFIKSCSSKIGEKYFNLELWPTSDNSIMLVVTPLFLPYIRLGAN